MDRREELSDFLRTRRERLQPEDVGLQRQPRRRAPGLRREDVALLSGVSVDYYTRIEQGRGRHPSLEVLQAIGRALRLDEAEQRHLETLADDRPAGPQAHARCTEKVRPGVKRLLTAFAPTTAALLLGRSRDVLAWNPLAAALIADFGQLPASRRNMLWLTFMDPATRALYPDWAQLAAEAVADLRLSSGRCPADTGLTALVEELSVKSAEFRQLWARHDVRQKSWGSKRFQHPSVGPLELSYEVLDCTADQVLVVYTAEAGSSSEQALSLLSVIGTSLREVAPTGSE
ncbi:transcriptional regulator [Streptomyces tateyamensis]|uniref:Transcriptional regulator n=1 Tax=Streptomyces tateyamensis TaxID=565073 RepID=A0A2V4NKI0_9ACTN|nr:helix-turn-helix transcriptional regulator [Streptomyces tateyamensis]PYC72369.1 transcriptional regulator [Streptomyces tateyamensis]